MLSTVGGRLRLASPWPTAAVKRSDRAAPVPLKPDGRGIVEIETKAGERLAVRKAELSMADVPEFKGFEPLKKK